jgi:outer membrane biosynthesis protein TonB
MRPDSLLNPDNSADQFLAKPRRERAIQITVRRNTVFAVLASLLLHAILLFWVIPKPEMNPIPQSTTIEVNLAPLPQKAPVIAAPTPQPEAQPEPEQPPAPKVIAKKPAVKPSKPKPQDFSLPEVMTQTQPSPLPMPAPTNKPPAPNEAPVDMMAMVNQRRAQRQAVESNAARQNAEAAAAERGPSEDEKRDQRIMQNLKVGTNGIFEIRRIDALGGSFSFKGWTDNANNARMQYFEVEAKPGEDTRLAIMRRMIALIREHYQGDFTWESHRLGRSVTLSARQEDNAGLEDFLMTEFFGKNYK